MAHLTRTATVVAALASLPGAGWASCPATSANVDTAVAAAEVAFEDMDQRAFVSARARAETLISCLTEPLGPAEAAAYHRMQGMAAFLDRDQPRALASFRAALAIEPQVELPEQVAPSGHPLERWYKAGRADDDASRALAVAAGLTTWVDGSPTPIIATGRPALVQVVQGDGSVRWSGTVPPGGTLPAGLK